MGFNPKVSIIIPVYNGSNYLREAIDSALDQTYKNIEVIVVNDGSTDDGKTEAIAKSYGDKIRYYSKENGGVSTALNFGILKAEGEYISWLSHDDVYTRYKIEKQIIFLNEYKRKNSKECVLYSNYININVLENKKKKITCPKVNPEILYESLMSIGVFIHGCTMLVPNESFDKVGYFDEKLQTTQDIDMWLRLNTIYDFVQMSEYFVESRDHPLQGSKVMKDIHEHEKDEVYKKALNYYFENDNKIKFNIKNYGKVILSLKKRRCRNAYKYSLKMLKEKKLTITGYDLIYLLYAFIYNRYLFHLKIDRILDRLP